LEAEKARLETEIVAAEQKVQDLKIALDQAEIREGKVSKFGEKIADRAREKFEEYKSAIAALKDEIEYYRGRVGTLEGILETLKKDHNQNYHDMAVKAAVSGWEELKDKEKPDFGITEEQLEILEKETIDLGDDTVDFTNEFDETVSLRIPPEFSCLTIVYRIQEYFPKQVKDFVSEKIAYIRSILADQGFLPHNKSGDGVTVSRGLQKARDAHAQAITETSRRQNELDSVSKQLTAEYGPNDVFLAIKGECFSLDSGEYTYSVCIMGQVNQKSNKDSTNTNLGYVHLKFLCSDLVLSPGLKMILERWFMTVVPDVGMVQRDQLEWNLNVVLRTKLSRLPNHRNVSTL
jgi:protein kinase C substrate 80K-H